MNAYTPKHNNYKFNSKYVKTTIWSSENWLKIGRNCRCTLTIHQNSICYLCWCETSSWAYLPVHKAKIPEIQTKVHNLTGLGHQRIVMGCQSSWKVSEKILERRELQGNKSQFLGLNFTKSLEQDYHTCPCDLYSTL